MVERVRMLWMGEGVRLTSALEEALLPPWTDVASSRRRESRENIISLYD